MVWRFFKTRGPWSPAWVTLQGPDAGDFLNRLSTARIQSLEVGQGCPGALLNASAKMIAYFYIWRIEAEAYALEIECGLATLEATLTHLERHTFGERFTLVKSTAQALWLFNENPTEKLPDVPELLRHEDNGELTYYSLWGTPVELSNWLASHLPNAAELTENEFERFRILSLKPRMDLEGSLGLNPLELGLQSAVARDKGCYPGQEVCEKIFTYGSPAKRIALFQVTSGEIKSGDLIGEAGDLGQITSITNGFALGVIRKTAAEAGRILKTKNGTVLQVVKISAYDPTV